MKSLAQEAADAIREFALRLPGAVEDFPWGESVAKVNKKIFVTLGRDTGEGNLTFSVKLPTSHVEALTLPNAAPTGYGLGKSGWVTLTLSPGDRPDINQLLAWVEESYRAIAPKKLIAQLDALG
jgi:predicted DNA-binding protein (MmcQ/YjbR family)